MDSANPQIAPPIKRASHSRLAPLNYERMAILIALADGSIDKAKIAEAVIADTVGAVILRKSTAYYLINELTNQAYIEKRGSYSLTDKGWRILQQELKRIEQQRLILKLRLHR